VARVGDERPLALERALEAVEHVVERVPEARELVVRGRDGHALAGVARGDRGRAPADQLDGPECAPHRAVADETGEQQRGGCGEGEDQRERPQRLVPILERRSDEHRQALAADVHEARDHARAVLLERLGAGLLERLDVDLVPIVVGRERNVLERHVGAFGGGPPRGRCEDRPQRKPWARREQPPVRADHLRERLAGVVESLREPGLRAAALDEQPRDRCGLGLELVVERLRELGPQPVVHERARRGEHHGHRRREHRGDANADRQPLGPQRSAHRR
jgi:hypothetical protein